MQKFTKDLQYYKFCLYGFLKNLKFFEPFLMLFFLDKGISFLQIGTLYAIREISINIIEIPSGVLADMLGRKKTMMTSFIAYIVSFVVFYYSTNYIWLAIAMLLFSLGDAMRTGTHKAMIFDYLKLNGWMSEKITYYGHTRSWSQIGSSISSIIAAIIVVFTGNYKIVFLFSTVPYIINLFLIWSYPLTLNGPINKLNNISVWHKFKLVYVDTVTSFKNKALWVTLINLSIYQGYFKTIKDYLQPIIVLAVGSSIVLSNISMEKRTAINIGVIYFVIYVVSSFTSRYSNKAVKWLKSPQKVINYTLILGLLAGIFSGVLVSNNSYVTAITIFILIFIIQNLRKPIGTSMVANKVKSEVLATGLSVQSQVDSIFASIFAIVTGFLIDIYGLGEALFYVGAGLLLISLFFLLKPDVKRDS